MLLVEVVIVGDASKVTVEVHAVVSADVGVFQACGVNPQIRQGLKAEAGEQTIGSRDLARGFSHKVQVALLHKPVVH